MDPLRLSKILVLSNKLKNNYKNYNSIDEVYTKLRSNNFIDSLLKSDNLLPREFVYLIFLIHLQNKGMNVDDIIRLLTNYLITFKIVYINSENPSLECEECYGNGENECGECYGTGRIDCRECDGSGEVDCEDCNGDGEDIDGRRCYECEGSGNAQCNECDGDGEINCNWCEGNGRDTCENCDGTGETTLDGYQEVYISEYVSINNKLRDRLIDLDDDSKIHEFYLDKMSKDGMTFLCNETYEMLMTYYGEFEENDYVFKSIDENPRFFLGSGNLIKTI